ncbi:DUF4177 domain-containing protein [Spirosoma pulveris]
MKKFEYLVLDVASTGFWSNKIDTQELTDTLNQLGSEGWELTSMVDVNQQQGATKGLLVTLKRELTN